MVLWRLQDSAQELWEELQDPSGALKVLSDREKVARICDGPAAFRAPKGGTCCSMLLWYVLSEVVSVKVLRSESQVTHDIKFCMIRVNVFRDWPGVWCVSTHNRMGCPCTQHLVLRWITISPTCNCGLGENNRIKVFLQFSEVDNIHGLRIPFMTVFYAAVNSRFRAQRVILSATEIEEQVYFLYSSFHVCFAGSLPSTLPAETKRFVQDLSALLCLDLEQTLDVFQSYFAKVYLVVRTKDIPTLLGEAVRMYIVYMYFAVDFCVWYSFIVL